MVSGVGAPNGNYFNGSIEFAPNLPWKGKIPLAQMIQDRIGIPVALTNDANAAAIGEMTYGAARGMKDFIVITLGTGVGSWYRRRWSARLRARWLRWRTRSHDRPSQWPYVRLWPSGLSRDLHVCYGCSTYGSRIPHHPLRRELAP